MELPLLIVGAVVVLVALLWRSRRGGSGDPSTTPMAATDRPGERDSLETARVHVGTHPGPVGPIGGGGGSGGGRA